MVAAQVLGPSIGMPLKYMIVISLKLFIDRGALTVQSLQNESFVFSSIAKPINKVTKSCHIIPNSVQYFFAMNVIMILSGISVFERQNNKI